MKAHDELLLVLLRRGMGTGGGEEAEKIVMRLIENGEAADRIWSAVFRLSSRQGVQGIVWDGLMELVCEGKMASELLPERALRLRWFGNVAEMERRNARQEAVLAKLAAVYARHGFRMMVLKGHGLSLLYPNPKHRPCGDIDIWLYGKQAEADDILQREYGVKIDNDHHMHTVFEVDGVMVENHYDFMNVEAHRSNRDIDLRLRKLVEAERDELISVKGNGVCLPPVNFNALFLLRHAAGHFAAEEIALRHLCDWAFFVNRHYAEIDWAALEAVARRHNMHRFLYCLNGLCMDVLGISPRCFPAARRDLPLERRILNNLLSPEFTLQKPKGSLPKILCFKCRRWWANRWKHRIVYREGLFSTFFVLLRAHLVKPKTLGV